MRMSLRTIHENVKVQPQAGSSNIPGALGRGICAESICEDCRRCDCTPYGVAGNADLAFCCSGLNPLDLHQVTKPCENSASNQ